jgi:hypothetical protein
VEHDYLTDGFWAMTRDQEKPAGFEISFLQYITDLTDTVRSLLPAGISEEGRRQACCRWWAPPWRRRPPRGNPTCWRTSR